MHRAVIEVSEKTAEYLKIWSQGNPMYFDPCVKNEEHVI
jgi:hypothetical protein